MTRDAAEDDEPGRLARLEMRVAEGEREIEALSDEVARQWAAIERLERQSALWAERFAALEDAMPPAPVSKPPHW